jgi:hypothetical protein
MPALVGDVAQHRGEIEGAHRSPERGPVEPGRQERDREDGEGRVAQPDLEHHLEVRASPTSGSRIGMAIEHAEQARESGEGDRELGEGQERVGRRHGLDV